MSMLKFFRFPFAVAGDKTAIPDPAQVTGAVSYAQGFGPDYELDPLVDPDGKDVPRDETNQLFYDVTNAIREYQTFGTPDFITSAQNGGTPFSYSKNARVLWSDGEVYESRINSNTDLPTVAASWRKVSGSNDQTLLIAVAGGTANALTASFSPSLTSLTNGVPFFIRCAAANTSAAPTLNVSGIGAKVIVKGANVALAPGDIPGSGFWGIFQYDSTLDCFVLANPASSAGTTGVVFDFAGTAAPLGAMALPFVPTNVSRTTYARLFAAIGTTWGAGNGSSTFGIPYCPENYAVIAANGNVGSASTGDVKSHSHTTNIAIASDAGQTANFGAGTPSVVGTRATGTAGGAANLAAGVRMLKCIWL